MNFLGRWASKESRKPIVAITLTMTSTVCLFVPLGLNTWNSYVTFSEVITRDAQIQHLTDQITYLDEVLTMSAQMNAATGKRQWERRYSEFVPKLDSAIEQINELSPDFYEQEGTAETEIANDKLIAMETRAFELVRNGELPAATALLNGRNYNNQKQIYRAGIRRSNRAIARQTQEARRQFGRSLLISSAISAVSLIILLPMWVGVLRIIGQYLSALELERLKTRELNANLEQRVEQRTSELTLAMKDLQQTQSQLVQTEKMSSLGEMVAGIAHEVNNPISFIQGNIPALTEYFRDLLSLVELYQKNYPQPADEIEEMQEDIEFDFLIEDVPKILMSMKMGTTRVRDIVISLRNYSRLDEAVVKDVDIHEGIESTLLILNHRIKNGVEVIKDYGTLPAVICSPSQLNQVFTNIITNGLDALSDSELAPKRIIITTRTADPNHVQISIRDTGSGMSTETKNRIFDPFFTTKPIGKGTGLGMGICFKIIEQHQGKIAVETEVGIGTEFIITLPVQNANAKNQEPENQKPERLQQTAA